MTYLERVEIGTGFEHLLRSCAGTVGLCHDGIFDLFGHEDISVLDVDFMLLFVVWKVELELERKKSWPMLLYRHMMS